MAVCICSLMFDNACGKTRLFVSLLRDDFCREDFACLTLASYCLRSVAFHLKPQAAGVLDSWWATSSNASNCVLPSRIYRKTVFTSMVSSFFVQAVCRISLIIHPPNLLCYQCMQPIKVIESFTC